MPEYLRFKDKGYQYINFYARPQIINSLIRYLEEGVPLGDFLTAVVSNDLKEAIGRADEDNMRNLPAIVAFLYNEAPGGGTCWGSPEAYANWLRMNREIREEKGAQG